MGFVENRTQIVDLLQNGNVLDLIPVRDNYHVEFTLSQHRQCLCIFFHNKRSENWVVPEISLDLRIPMVDQTHWAHDKAFVFILVKRIFFDGGL
jgi:hypothetical protein